MMKKKKIKFVLPTFLVNTWIVLVIFSGGLFFHEDSINIIFFHQNKLKKVIVTLNNLLSQQ